MEAWRLTNDCHVGVKEPAEACEAPGMCGAYLQVFLRSHLLPQDIIEF